MVIVVALETHWLYIAFRKIVLSLDYFCACQCSSRWLLGRPASRRSVFTSTMTDGRTFEFIELFSQIKAGWRFFCFTFVMGLVLVVGKIFDSALTLLPEVRWGLGLLLVFLLFYAVTTLSKRERDVRTVSGFYEPEGPIGRRGEEFLESLFFARDVSLDFAIWCRVQ